MLSDSETFLVDEIWLKRETTYESSPSASALPAADDPEKALIEAALGKAGAGSRVHQEPLRGLESHARRWNRKSSDWESTSTASKAEKIVEKDRAISEIQLYVMQRDIARMYLMYQEMLEFAEQNPSSIAPTILGTPG